MKSKVKKQDEAGMRRLSRKGRTNTQQEHVLDARLGNGVGATKERRRLRE